MTLSFEIEPPKKPSHDVVRDSLHRMLREQEREWQRRVDRDDGLAVAETTAVALRCGNAGLRPRTEGADTVAATHPTFRVPVLAATPIPPTRESTKTLLTSHFHHVVSIQSRGIHHMSVKKKSAAAFLSPPPSILHQI